MNPYSSPVLVFRTRISTGVRWAGLLASMVISVCVSAQSDPPSSGNPSPSSEIQIGIGGHYRVGHLTSIRIRSEFARTLASKEVSIETTDGDGIPVRTPVPSVDPSNGAWSEIGYVAPGSEAARVAIVSKPLAEAIDADAEITEIETRFPLAGNPATGPSMIAASQPWVVSIGDPLGVDEIGKSNVLLDKAARIAVTKIDEAGMLPRRAWGYDGVDMMMLNATGAAVLEALDTSQRTALIQWTKRGGRVLICLGDWTRDVKAKLPWLFELLPAVDADSNTYKVTRYDPAAFETFTSSQTPLERFDGIRLPRSLGRPILMGRTSRRVSAVLAGEYVCGLGRCTVIAADLDSELFRSWPERRNLVTQVMGDFFAEPDERVERDGSIAFNDLAGQMRGALDQFSMKPQFSFSVLSLVLMILIAVLGPLDYLLVNRLLGKPLLGWISFPLFAVALSLFLISQSSPRTRGGSESEDIAGSDSPLRANQFQVVDLDLVRGVGRGFAWTYFYSHDPARIDAQWNLTPSLDPLLREPSSRQQIVYPMGYPGRSFGGIQLTGVTQTMDPYRLNAFDGEESSARVQGLTIAPRSSRSIACEMGMTVATVSGESGLVRRPGSELLRGSFTNPLPIDLLDGQIIFGNWVYLLPTRVPAGSTIASLADLRQKNFRWKLTRQQSFEKNVTESDPWQPNDFSEPDRIAELMMFHRAAGGSLYTGLVHRPLGELDLSGILDESRCLLVGRTESPLISLAVEGSASGTSGTAEGDIVSQIRVVLPVRSTLLD